MIKTVPFLGVIIIISLLIWTSHVNAQLFGEANQNRTGLQSSRAMPENVLIILDASDSMNEKMGNRPKIQIAKEVVLQTIRSIPQHVNVGLRVYGHKLGGSSFTIQGPFGNFMSGGEICRQTQLIVPLGSSNRATMASQLLNVKAVGKTPITYTLQEAVNNDFVGLKGKKTIILVSDGRETCSYNPCDFALAAVRSGIDIKINTIGFGTRDRMADDQLRCVALSTKGKFYNANTAADLAKSLNESADIQTSVQAKIYPGP